MQTLFGINWINDVDQNGNTPLHSVFSNKSVQNHGFFKDKVAHVMDRGFDPYIKNKEGKSVIDLAKTNGWNDLLVMLK